MKIKGSCNEIPSSHTIQPGIKERVLHSISWFTSPIIQTNQSPYAYFQHLTQFVRVPAPLVTSWKWLIYDCLTSNLALLFLCILFFSPPWWPLLTHWSLFISVSIHLTDRVPPIVCVFLLSPFTDHLNFHLIIFTWLTVLRSLDMI